MESKFKIFLRKNKALIIGCIIVWIAIDVFLIAPIAYSHTRSIVNGKLNITIFTENFVANFMSFNSITHAFEEGVFQEFAKGSLISLIIVIIFGAIGQYKGRKKSEFDKIEHGSSDWAKDGEQYRILSERNGLMLATDNYLPLDKIGNINVLIVGGSGSGKSSAYSDPNAHQCLGSYVFTDPKGELYDTTAGYLKSQGYDIKVLNLVNPESSDGYNPLFQIQSEMDVDIIASTIVKGQKKEGSDDPFWDNMSEFLLKALIYYLLAARPLEEQNLASCAEMVRAASNNGDTNTLADLIHQLPPEHPARMNFQSVEVSAGSEKTYSSILASLQSSLGKFDSEEIASLTSTNTINFEDIGRKKTALYVISSDTHSAYDFLLTIFFSQMIQHLYDFADKNGGKLPVPTFFILDEFANIGQIPDFDKKISTSRSRGISFSVILQNLDQLKSIYEKSYETIIGNCDTHVFLGSNSYATVEYFSKELGEKTISHDSKSINRDSHSMKTGTSDSKQIMARALMTPDELRRLPTDECIIFEKGLKPIKAKKHFWYLDKKISTDLNSHRLDHNNYDAGSRGEWRKFNPYNPYQENKTEKEEIQSLDSLFDEARPQEEKQKEELKAEQLPNNNYAISGDEVITSSMMQRPSNQNNEPKQENNAKEEQNKKDDKPAYEMDEDEIDLEKELEAKFDELFGKM